MDEIQKLLGHYESLSRMDAQEEIASNYLKLIALELYNHFDLTIKNSIKTINDKKRIECGWNQNENEKNKIQYGDTNVGWKEHLSIMAQADIDISVVFSSNINYSDAKSQIVALKEERNKIAHQSKVSPNISFDDLKKQLKTIDKILKHLE